MCQTPAQSQYKLEKYEKVDNLKKKNSVWEMKQLYLFIFIPHFTADDSENSSTESCKSGTIQI